MDAEMIPGIWSEYFWYSMLNTYQLFWSCSFLNTVSVNLVDCGSSLECSLAAQAADYLQDSQQNTMQKSFAILVPIPGSIVIDQQ